MALQLLHTYVSATEYQNCVFSFEMYYKIENLSQNLRIKNIRKTFRPKQEIREVATRVVVIGMAFSM
jgi:ABC-type ATPase with predicted acetyltransferase domain